jgi:hypothetical protein
VKPVIRLWADGTLMVGKGELAGTVGWGQPKGIVDALHGSLQKQYSWTGNEKPAAK